MREASNIANAGVIMIPLLVAALILPLGCGSSGGSGTGTSAAYNNRIADYKATYGMSDAWESWMQANASRYTAAFAASSSKPAILDISFRYETTPINYNPAWVSEAEHMNVFTTMAQGAYPGYNFNFEFLGNTTTSYANIIAGTAGTTSYSLGKNVYLYFETIFNHEFGHTMNLLHHYDLTSQIGNGMHMPPGETQCIMDRNSTLFCSACRTSLGIPLDIFDTTAMDAAMTNILSRYPY